MYAKSVKPRPREEYLNSRLFRPLAHLLVVPLARTRITPPQVVMFHTALGLLAAVLVARGGGWVPALLLQVKTVLDNADGQLARATDQTSELGRYLDTEMDLLVNAALFAAIGSVSGQWLLAALAFCVMTLVLTVDFVWESEYRAARGEIFRDPPVLEGGSVRLLVLLRAFYTFFYVPQERWVRRWGERRFRAVVGPSPTGAQLKAARLAYTTGNTVAVLVNFGLTTQLAAAGACLALGQPVAYLWLVLLQGLTVLYLQSYRERAARHALRTLIA
nr:CDP-alcohol phosphatidyltransferase family protein [Deinobacterium chartae]